MLTGTYLSGDSVLHRAPPVVKVLVLALATTALFMLARPLTTALCGVLVGVGYLIARVPPRLAVAQVWPLRWFVGLLGAFQVWQFGWPVALVVCSNLALAVAAASLVTLTTRVDDMRAALESALARARARGVPVDPERAGLAVALVIRSIPVIVALSRTAREARMARGMQRSVRAFVTPLVIRTVRHADRVGEALIARGIDD